MKEQIEARIQEIETLRQTLAEEHAAKLDAVNLKEQELAALKAELNASSFSVRPEAEELQQLNIALVIINQYAQEG